MSDTLNFLVLVETGRALRSLKTGIELDETENLQQVLCLVKETKIQIHRLEILSKRLSQPFSTELLTLAKGFRESLGQPDISAAMAEQDGFVEEAVAICKDALASSLSRWQHRIEEYNAKAMASAQLESDEGILCSEIENAIGMDAKAFFHLSNEDLAVLLKSMPLVTSSSNAPTDHVTLLQCSALVNRTKRTLERWKTDDTTFPTPEVIGSNGTADEWLWTTIRPYLERKARRELPVVFPSHVAN